MLSSMDHLLPSPWPATVTPLPNAADATCRDGGATSPVAPFSALPPSPSSSHPLLPSQAAADGSRSASVSSDAANASEPLPSSGEHLPSSSGGPASHPHAGGTPPPPVGSTCPL